MLKHWRRFTSSFGSTELDTWGNKNTAYAPEPLFVYWFFMLIALCCAIYGTLRVWFYTRVLGRRRVPYSPGEV